MRTGLQPLGSLTQLIIKTQLRHGNLLFQDRICVSELELLHAHPQTRPEIIATARRLSYARVLNSWRKYLQEHPTK